jgi:ferredoxin
MNDKKIRIDRDKCTGCGLCVPDCPAGALRIVNGKAELSESSVCDGLGACIGKCPNGALSLEGSVKTPVPEGGFSEHGCPGTSRQQPARGKPPAWQWPIQLKLISPGAGCFAVTRLLIAADCVPFVWKKFHEEYPEKTGMAVFCPKLDRSSDEYVEKLSDIIKNNPVKEVHVLRMQVPCCGGATAIGVRAVEAAGKDTDIREIIVSLDGSKLGEMKVKV